MKYEYQENQRLPHTIGIEFDFNQRNRLLTLAELDQVFGTIRSELPSFVWDDYVKCLYRSGVFAGAIVRRRFSDYLAQTDSNRVKVCWSEKWVNSPTGVVRMCFRDKADAMLFKLTYSGE